MQRSQQRSVLRAGQSSGAPCWFLLTDFRLFLMLCVGHNDRGRPPRHGPARYKCINCESSRLVILYTRTAHLLATSNTISRGIALKVTPTLTITICLPMEIRQDARNVRTFHSFLFRSIFFVEIMSFLCRVDIYFCASSGIVRKYFCRYICFLYW